MTEAAIEKPSPHGAFPSRISLAAGGGTALVTALLVAIYWIPIQQMVTIWGLPDSYYSHGYLIVPISLYLVWRKRAVLSDTPIRHSWLGYPLIFLSVFLLIAGAFFGFSVFEHFSLPLMIAGVLLALLGTGWMAHLWFPVLFLYFMVPIPPSITQSVALALKLTATSGAVFLARLMTLPMIHDGSFVLFGNDKLLIGNVCGGLRSLISMLALGLLMAYFSRCRWWARLLIVGLAGPIAIASNVFRILLLCIVAYFWGSQSAVGLVHDVSGFLMFGLAFALFIAVESLLRKWARLPQKEGPVS